MYYDGTRVTTDDETPGFVIRTSAKHPTHRSPDGRSVSSDSELDVRHQEKHLPRMTLTPHTSKRAFDITADWKPSSAYSKGYWLATEEIQYVLAACTASGVDNTRVTSQLHDVAVQEPTGQGQTSGECHAASVASLHRKHSASQYPGGGSP